MATPYQTLHPSLKPRVDRILKALTAKGWQPIVASGGRTVAEQKIKVAKGYSKTMQSRHIGGFAADIVDKRYGWNIAINHPFWLDLGTEALKDPKLRWGGIWSNTARLPIFIRAVKEKKLRLITWFCDVAHVELRR